MADQPTLVKVSRSGSDMLGLRLMQQPSRRVVLTRDGWIHYLHSDDSETTVTPVSGRYTPATAAEMRSSLTAEFGREFEIVPTTHFLVVQPAGRGDRWPQIFERLHREFVSYMEVRGVAVRNGRFPMVAVILPDEVAMRQEFVKLGIDAPRVAGLYHTASNRIVMHDGGRSEYTAATVRHEAAHQSAYNTGVHSRVSDTPRWTVEGVGGLFEPPAMQDRLRNRSITDRINADDLQLLREKYPTAAPLAADVRRLVTDETMFTNEAETRTAYAVSWLMMFYLAERQPNGFAAIVNQTATLPPFETYGRDDRLADFRHAVGDVDRFAEDLHWFMRKL